MSAAVSLRPAADNFTLVVGSADLFSIRRIYEVVFTTGRAPRIDIRRELLTTGESRGSLMLHADVFASLWAALRAIREGRPFGDSDSLGRGERMQFHARERETLEIRMFGPDGAPRGAPTILRGRELVLLAEALRLARHKEDR